MKLVLVCAFCGCVFLVVYFDQSYCLVGNTFRIPAALRKSDSHKRKRSFTSGEEEALVDSQSLSEYLHRSCESNIHLLCHTLTQVALTCHSHTYNTSLLHITHPPTHSLTHSLTHLLPEDDQQSWPLHRQSIHHLIKLVQYLLSQISLQQTPNNLSIHTIVTECTYQGFSVSQLLRYMHSSFLLFENHPSSTLGVEINFTECM